MGFSQHSYKVTCANKRMFFAKYFDDQHSNAAAIEREVLQSSQALSITLPLVYADTKWLITPFVDNNTLAQTSMSSTNKIMLTLDLMLGFQKIPLTSACVKSINFIEILKFYRDKLQLNPTCVAVLTPLLNVSLANEALLVLSHGDLNFSNILMADQGQQRATLIDFECCCYAEAEYDIAMMFAINNLVESYLFTDVFKSVSHYLATHNVKLSKEKVTRYLSISLIINALWYLDKFKLTTDKKWLVLAREQLTQAETLKVTQYNLMELLLPS
ncbi:phosphotransferase [Thalassotalea piscium]